MDIVTELTSHIRKYHPTAEVEIEGDILSVEADCSAVFDRGSSFGREIPTYRKLVLYYDMKEGREIIGRLGHVGLRHTDLLLLREGVPLG